MDKQRGQAIANQQLVYKKLLLPQIDSKGKSERARMVAICSEVILSFYVFCRN